MGNTNYQEKYGHAPLDIASCEALLEEYGTPRPVRKHCRATAKMALQLAEGTDIDRDLLSSAAMLHDIARAEKNHAMAGAKILESVGYPEIAEVIAVHHNLPKDDQIRINEKSLLYLADKCVLEDQPVSIETRFSHSMQKIRDPEARKQHGCRYEQAKRVQELLKVEKKDEYCNCFK